MKKNNICLKKIYFGILMILLNLIYFYFFTYIDRKFHLSIFIYSFLIIILFFIILASRDILKLKEQKKNLFLNKNIIFFSFLFFFHFVAIFNNYFYNNQAITFLMKKKDFLLYQIIDFLYKNHYFLFFSLLYLFIFFLFFLFISDFEVIQFQNILFVIIYIIFFSSCFFTLVSLNYNWFLYLFLITTTSDSFAFLGGYFFGKKKLCPIISNKKTWEGFFCGIICTLFFVFLFFFNSLKVLDFLSFLCFFIFSLLNSILAQIGDLIASKIKRNFNIKDFNNILPGHGGLLDRFDSILFLSFFNVLVFISPLNQFKNLILYILS
ncbi:phosphatidate cytidylyltransferase ['Cynodon dactylon' phytoplasma]|uniref:phosphatidate cytidylyltransferase n=1 Tax='Cynodon dactylon' phytoplasma TaxID=295320 RepID=UPI001265B7EC|nr:CDP-archaeol synthase ['Cynodon dactylon' phytoplasma]KAB8121763.1 CDP-archaeol synthase ['Cynodon dactylon' phytoplasma]